jgi:predicted DNA-binding transcriptional regulator AlpA
MEYRITIETEPVPEEDWSETVDTVLDDLRAMMGIEGVTGWGTAPNTVGVVFEIDAANGQEAVYSGIEAFGGIARKAMGMTADETMNLRRVEVEPLLYVDEGPSLLGATDVARLLRISRQRVYQLLEEQPHFPRPAAETARGMLWNRGEIVHWANSREGEQRLDDLAAHLEVSQRR